MTSPILRPSLGTSLPIHPSLGWAPQEATHDLFTDKTHPRWPKLPSSLPRTSTRKPSKATPVKLESRCSSHSRQCSSQPSKLSVPASSTASSLPCWQSQRLARPITPAYKREITNCSPRLRGSRRPYCTTKDKETPPFPGNLAGLGAAQRRVRYYTKVPRTLS